MPVVGSSPLAWQAILFFTLALATGRSWGQRVVVVDPNNQPLESAYLRWTCRGGGQPQNVTIDEQGVSWPTPKCSEATVVASAFGYLTDTLVLVRPASEQVDLQITLPHERRLAIGRGGRAIQRTFGLHEFAGGRGMYRGIKSISIAPEAQHRWGGGPDAQRICGTPWSEHLGK